MPQFTYGVSLSGGGLSVQKTITRTAETAGAFDVPIPAAKALTSWVKTDANTGGGNLAGGHGQTDGKFDVYWDGGKRIGMDGTISTNALALDGGAGDDLPASANATVRVCKQVVINTPIDGDAIVIIGISLEHPVQNGVVGHIDMLDSGPASIFSMALEANVPFPCDVEGGAANVFTGNPIVVTHASQSDTTTEAKLKIMVLLDPTP